MYLLSINYVLIDIELELETSKIICFFPFSGLLNSINFMLIIGEKMYLARSISVTYLCFIGHVLSGHVHKLVCTYKGY